MKREKKFTKDFMFSFAEHCMLKLVSKKTNDDSYPEVSYSDLHRIHKILREFNKK